MKTTTKKYYFNKFSLKITIFRELKNFKNDLVYKYSSVENETNRQMSGAVELMQNVRGMFMTLSCALKELCKNDEAV